MILRDGRAGGEVFLRVEGRGSSISGRMGRVAGGPKGGPSRHRATSCRPYA